MSIPFSSRKKDNLEILQELVRIVTPQKLQKARPITEYKSHNKIRKLYDGIRAQKWKSEREAMNDIYGKDGSMNTFAKLKSDLSEKLIADILLINLKDTDEPNAKKAHWECMIKFNTAVFMYKFTPYDKAPQVLLEKILPKCLKFEFTDLIIAICEIFAWDYKLKADTRKGGYYEQLLMDHLQIQLAECKGKMFLGNIYAHYATNKSYKPVIAEQAISYLHELSQVTIPYETHKTIYYKKMMEVIFYMSKFNYIKTADLCEETIAYFEQKDFVIPSTLRAFYFQAIASYTYLRQPAKGYRLLYNCQQLVANIGSVNWFKMQELTIMLALYSEDYSKAYDVFVETVNQERFTKQAAYVTEYWKLIEAMLYVVQCAGELTSTTNRPLQIRFSTFVNSVPKLSQDKSGTNFSIQLIQLFTLLQKETPKAYEEYTDRTEQLTNYFTRYCKDETMQRTRWMFELTCLIPTSRFSSTLVKNNAKVAELIHKLRHTPYDITDNNLDIEIIPFDRFFQFMCSKLR